MLTIFLKKIDRNYLQFALVLCASQILISIGLGACSALAPDERLYVELFNELYSEKIDSDLKFAGTANWVYFLFFLPGFLLANLGIEPIYSVRGSAIFHSQVVFAVSWRYLKHIPRIHKAPVFLIPLCLSLSFFSFSSLGLRESFVFLNLILYFASIDLIRKQRSFSGGLILVCSLIIFANLKLYIFALIVLSTLMALIFLKKREGARVISISLLLSFAAIYVTPSSEFNLVQDVAAKGGLKFEFQELKFFEFDFRSFLNSGTDVRSVTRTEFIKCQKDGSLGILRPIVDGLLAWDATNQNGSVLSATDFYSSDKPREVVVIGHIPYNLINFMIGPIPGTSAGMSFLGLFDSILWFVTYIFFTLIFLGKTRFRIEFDNLVAFSATFFLTFLLFSAAYEVNSGTSFRHRMLLVVPLIIIFSRLHLRGVPSNPRIPSDSE